MLNRRRNLAAQTREQYRLAGLRVVVVDPQYQYADGCALVVQWQTQQLARAAKLQQLSIDHRQTVTRCIRRMQRLLLQQGVADEAAVGQQWHDEVGSGRCVGFYIWWSCIGRQRLLLGIKCEQKGLLDAQRHEDDAANGLIQRGARLLAPQLAIHLTQLRQLSETLAQLLRCAVAIVAADIDVETAGNSFDVGADALAQFP